MVLEGGAFGRWLGHESGVHDISALIKGTPENFLTRSAMWGHSKKMAIYEPGSGHSPNTEFASTLILDFSASGTVRNKYLLFKPPSLVVLL